MVFTIPSIRWKSRRKSKKNAKKRRNRRYEDGKRAISSLEPFDFSQKKGFSVCIRHGRMLYYILSYLRRDGRVVEGAALEMLYRGNSIVGSNPTLSAIFFAPSRFFKSESLCVAISKTRWHKGFYKTCCRVFETHSDSRIRPFFRKNPPFSVWILTIPGKPQKLERLHNSFIISNNAFLYSTEPRGG